MPNDKKNKKTTAVQKNVREKENRTPQDTRGTAKKAEPEQRRIDPVPESSRFMNQLLPFVFVVAAILLTAFFLLSKIDGAVGTVGVVIRDFFCGLLGWPAFIIPLILLNLAVFWRKYVDLGIVRPKLWLSLGCVTVISSLVHVFSIPKMNPTHYNWGDYGASIFGTGEPLSNWTYGIRLTGGGFFGGLIGGLVRSSFGFAGALIILIALLIIFVLFLFGVTPGYLIDMIKYKAKKNREANADVREERREERRAEKAERREEKRAIQADRRRAAVIGADAARGPRGTACRTPRRARTCRRRGEKASYPRF